MNSPSPPADTLEKRRKQIEKAKAAHLSRQLQTRLQYARLKVDHGWQKQTLNEVENLYFHHYRARIPPRSAPKTEKNSSAPSVSESPPVSVSADPTPISHSNSGDQDPSPHAVSQPSLTPNVPDESAQSGMDVDTPAAAPPASTSSPNLSSTEPTSAPALQQQSQRSSQSATPSAPQHSPPLRPPAMTKSPPRAPPSAPNHTIQHPARSSVGHASTSSFISSTSRSSSYSQPTSAQMGSLGPPPPALPSPSLVSSSLPGSSNVALTYDSFWSSHSSTSNNYRSSLASVASITTVGKDDVGTGLQNFGPTYTLAVGGPPTSFQPLPPAKRLTNVTRKRAVPAASTESMRHTVGAAEGGG